MPHHRWGITMAAIPQIFTVNLPCLSSLSYRLPSLCSVENAVCLLLTLQSPQRTYFPHSKSLRCHSPWDYQSLSKLPSCCSMIQSPPTSWGEEEVLCVLLMEICLPGRGQWFHYCRGTERNTSEALVTGGNYCWLCWLLVLHWLICKFSNS